MKTTPAAESTREDQQRKKAAVACDRILGQVPTIFGKLVNLAGFQIQGAGDYSHPQLDRVFPSAIVNSLLQERHEHAFSQWLSLTFEEQHKELTEFFCSMWTEAKPRLPERVRQALVPATAREAERSLFLSDLECNLGLLVRESL